jgi:hypothetical protein
VSDAPIDLTVTPEEGSTVVRQGDGGWTYEWSARKRPFLHPVATPSGTVLTRNAPEDHPWHHGLWFTIKFVNEENFWEEYDAYGVLRHDGPPAATLADDGSASVRGDLTWIRPDRETVVIDEQRSFTHVPLSDDAYGIDVDTTITPRTDVLLDRTPFTTWGGYGGLAFRGRGDWTDTRLLLDDGVERERALGEPSKWCDLSGSVDGGQAGFTMLAHPDSPRHPVPWYASTKAATYGDEGWSNFCNAAFLWDEALPVAAGEGLRFRYRVVVHDGTWDAEQAETAWQAYAGDAVEDAR